MKAICPLSAFICQGQIILVLLLFLHDIADFSSLTDLLKCLRTLNTVQYISIEQNIPCRKANVSDLYSSAFTTVEMLRQYQRRIFFMIIWMTSSNLMILLGNRRNIRFLTQRKDVDLSLSAWSFTGYCHIYCLFLVLQPSRCLYFSMWYFSLPQSWCYLFHSSRKFSLRNHNSKYGNLKWKKHETNDKTDYWGTVS